MNPPGSALPPVEVAASRGPGLSLRVLNVLLLGCLPHMVFIAYTDWQIRGLWYPQLTFAGGAVLITAHLLGRFGIWNLYQSAHRKLARIPTALAVIGLILWLAGMAISINVFMAQDRCLDQGGRWAHKTQSCEK